MASRCGRWPMLTRRRRRTKSPERTRSPLRDPATAPDGGMWFTSQRSGQLGWFDRTAARWWIAGFSGSSGCRRNAVRTGRATSAIQAAICALHTGDPAITAPAYIGTAEGTHAGTMPAGAAPPIKETLMNAMSTATGHELRFRSLFNEGCGLAFPCDEHGVVQMDALSARALNNYLYARTVVGREFFTPVVLPCLAHHPSLPPVNCSGATTASRKPSGGPLRADARAECSAPRPRGKPSVESPRRHGPFRGKSRWPSRSSRATPAAVRASAGASSRRSGPVHMDIGSLGTCSPAG